MTIPNDVVQASEKLAMKLHDAIEAHYPTENFPTGEVLVTLATMLGSLISMQQGAQKVASLMLAMQILQKTVTAPPGDEAAAPDKRKMWN